jgi:hypothetical protein
MTTNHYTNRNNFRLRTGARSSGVSGAADRLYSFWFKTFTYESPVTAALPLTLLDWNARLNDNKVLLSWATDMQKNTSHFVIDVAQTERIMMKLCFYSQRVTVTSTRSIAIPINCQQEAPVFFTTP